MNCPECNTNKENRAEYLKNLRCGCCGGVREISFHRFVQWNLGWVCWLSGNSDASVSEMNDRCLSIIKDCYNKVNKKINREIKECDNKNYSPSEVTQFYCSQFQGADCKVKNNY